MDLATVRALVLVASEPLYRSASQIRRRRVALHFDTSGALTARSATPASARERTPVPWRRS